MDTGTERKITEGLQQGERHLSGGEDSLELALTGLRAPEMELDALMDIARIEGQGRA